MYASTETNIGVIYTVSRLHDRCIGNLSLLNDQLSTIPTHNIELKTKLTYNLVVPCLLLERTPHLDT